MSKCFCKEFGENTGACCTQSSRCEEKNVTLPHMLNCVNMIDTNPPVSLPMQSANSGKGSVFGHNWCLHHGLWLQLRISSPVIAGMHGWRAGIGTVHKMINDNPHDRRGPLKLPARQQAMVLLAFSLYSYPNSWCPHRKPLCLLMGPEHLYNSALQIQVCINNLEFLSLAQGYPNTPLTARLKHKSEYSPWRRISAGKDKQRGKI